MTDDWELLLRLTGQRAVVEDLESKISGLVGFRVLASAAPVDNPSEFRLDVGQVAAFTAAVTGGVFGKALVPMVWQFLQKHKGSKISIESPLGRVTFESDREYSEDQVRELLKRLTEDL